MSLNSFSRQYAQQVGFFLQKRGSSRECLWSLQTIGATEQEKVAARIARGAKQLVRLGRLCNPVSLQRGEGPRDERDAGGATTRKFATSLAHYRAPTLETI